MKFRYSSVIAGESESGDFFILRRPEIPITIVGPNGSVALIGLVDTGADFTIVPKSISDALGIDVTPAEGPESRVFGGHQIDLLAGEATIILESEGDSLTWAGPISFFRFADSEEETVILGHAGFLDYFVATFDAESAVLELTPNNNFPSGI